MVVISIVSYGYFNQQTCNVCGQRHPCGACLLRNPPNPFKAAQTGCPLGGALGHRRRRPWGEKPTKIVV